jgi:small subunit ribosomal protein S6
MLRYETLMLAKTEMTEDELSALESQFAKFAGDVQGKLNSFDKWGKYKLCYPVEKQTHGVYVLARYDLPEDAASKTLKEIETFFQIKCNELVLRYVTKRLKHNAPTTYQKPDSMETARSGGDAFFKDSKIENLLSSVGGSHDDVDNDLDS